MYFLSVFVIIFCILVKLYECILLPPNVIFVLIEELRILNPTILYNYVTPNHLLKTKLFKEFANHGKTIRYQVAGNHQYYNSNIIFTDLQKFNFNLIDNHPKLIVTQIENEGDLKLINLSINTEVYFMDELSWKLYETYTINHIHATNNLGKVKNNSEKILDDQISSFDKRRRNFHGIQLNGMMDIQKPFTKFPNDFVSKVNYFSHNKTYDMTNIVDGVYIEVLHSLEKMLNFSTKLYMRKDRKWGMPQELSNGTTILDGMLKSLVEEDSVDFIWTSFSMLPARFLYVDFLPPLSKEYGGIFIPNQDSVEKIQYYILFEPFSVNVWVAILVTDLFIGSLIFIIQWLRTSNTLVKNDLAIF